MRYAWCAVALLASVLIGMGANAIGYDVTTWQYWLIAMPLSFYIGYLCGMRAAQYE